MRFKAFYLKETENDLDKFQNQLKDKYELSHLRLFKKGSDLILDMIVVPKDKRKQGIGSKVLNDITHYADINGLRILLTTGVKDDFHGTTSSTRLKQFYKKQLLFHLLEHTIHHLQELEILKGFDLITFH